MSVAWLNYQVSVDQVEGHITRGCDLGTSGHTPAVSTPATLRKRFLLKGEGMLGSDPNPFPWVISY
jgi:hypothetical protein